jgi:Arc/MetJ-type ribon-helix-helix transcriptional regulator
MDLPLNKEERAFIEEQLRSGRAANQEEILREGLQLLMDRDADERRKYEAWRADVRQKIDEGYEESLTDEGIDGAAFLEELRLELQSRREVEP